MNAQVYNTVKKYSKCDAAKITLQDQALSFNFSIALGALKRGKQVARVGWNGKGMYLFLIGVEGSNDYWTYTNEKNDNYLLEPFIAIKTAGNSVVPWTPGQTDLLANDWVIL
jgi:hypothetical protein